uniref:Uncharacterized protein n=1 Tax=Rhizophora mucronata TaxID=61149 RepID=A0A2P2MVT6_RHIMU
MLWLVLQVSCYQI